MKIAVINGTEVKGCTYRLKESFLGELRAENEVREFTLPKDMPHFCCGCKVCFFKSEKLCPHGEFVLPIWNAMLEADLLVFAYPVYALRAPGQLKALLDHLTCHWMVHRPEEQMFQKRAVILTQSIGAPNGAAQKDVATSLMWLGVPNIKRLGFGLMEGVIWEELPEKRRLRIEEKCSRLARSYRGRKPAGKSLKVRTLFMMAKMMHQSLLKKEDSLSADNRHWLERGWIRGKADTPKPEKGA